MSEECSNGFDASFTEDMIEKFVENFDPLALLDAEYAAVVAQTRTNDPQEKTKNEDGFNSEEEEDDYLEPSNYALLPTSPMSATDGISDDEEDESKQERNPQTSNETSESISRVTTAAIDPSSRQTIMETMQKMQLQPPSWAKESNFSDTDLIAMVQQRLQMSNTSNSNSDSVKPQ